MMLRAITIGLLCLSPLSALGQAEPDKVVPFDPNDADMNAAVAQAQKTLPLFLSNTVDDQGFGPDAGYLKVAFPVEDPVMNTENIWVGPFLALVQGVCKGVG